MQMAETYGTDVFNKSWISQIIENILQIVSPDEFAHDYAFEVKNNNDLIHIMNFLAIKSTDTQRVLSHFKILDAKKASWTPQLMSYAINRIFISEVMHGWVFVLGPGLSNRYLKDELELENLSQKFGEACYFFYNSDSMIFKWSRAIDGKISRSYYDKSYDEEEIRKQKEFAVKSQIFHKSDEDESELVRASGYPTEAEKTFKQYGEDTLGSPKNVQEMIKFWIIQKNHFPSEPKGYLGTLI